MRFTLPFKKGTVLFRLGDFGPAWRITTGMFRLEVQGATQPILLQLAGAGDLVGAETIFAEPYSSTATALVDSEVELVQPDTDPARFAAVAQACRQQQQRMRDMSQLRSGSTSARVGHLLKMLSHKDRGIEVPVDRKDLPTLKEMATIVDVASETVCRELNVFMPARPYQRAPRATCPRHGQTALAA